MIRGISLNQTDIIVDHNYFYNNAHGIDAYYAEHESSIIDISDCSFYGNSNITGRGIEITGSQVSNIEDNYFYELELGIFLSNGALYEVSDIIDNTMEKVEYGIRGVGHNSRCDIKDNDIRSESHSVMVFGTWGEYQQQWATQYNDRISSLYGTPILYNNMNNGRIFKNDWIISEGHGTGVKINGGTFNHVGYNDIEGWINNSRGIGVSGTDLSSVYCNYTGTDDGIGVYGNNSGTELRENRLATSINSIEYGSTLNGFAHTGIQDYKGNRFGISTSSSPKATNYSVLNVAEQNRFLVGILAGNQGTVLYPYFTSADNNWFNPDNVGADSDNCFPGFTSVTGLTDNELKKVVDGDVSIIEIVKNPYGEDIEFETVVTTIEHITKYNEQTGGNFYNSILTDPDYFDAAQLVGIENDLNAILNEELITDAEYDTWQSDINNVISDIESYELFTYDITTDQLISNSNSQYYQGLLASLETIKSRHSTEISAKQLELDQVVPLLKSRLQSLPRPTSGAGKYLSDITSIGLNVLTSNFTEFSQSQITMINAISEKCGYKYGKSVYLARSLRAIYETNSIPDYVSCDDIPMNNISKKLDISPAMVNFSLYPNPASEVITLSISNIDGGSFEIFNTLGLIVEKIIIEPKIKSVDINISEYPAGIYMMKDVTGIQKTIKFIKTN